MGPGRSEPLIVEAYVGADGRVQDYRVLSGGEDGSEVLSELKNMLIFATFRPATSFGRPTAGRAILAFSQDTGQGIKRGFQPPLSSAPRSSRRG